MPEESVKRKLTAILCADVKGYSRMMGEDEVGTFHTLSDYLEIINTIIAAHHGRVFSSPGDAILAQFASVVDAVQCAVEIQEKIETKNADVPEDRKMRLRIGVNLGDVIEKEEQIYGDGVNIAARIETLAEPGKVSISKNVYRNVRNKLKFGYEYQGEHQVKNIAEPLRVYKVLTAPEHAGQLIGEPKPPKLPSKKSFISIFVVLALVIAAAIWQFYPRPPEIEPASVENMAYLLPEKPSIAVLPFDNLSGDQSQEYIADGLSENIISSLSKIPDLMVIARNSTFVYKGKAVKVNQVAEELGVKYVLEGSVQKSGEKLRVTAQLIDALKGHHLWSEKYDKAAKDFFTVQDDITRNIVIALQVELTQGEQARIWHDTENLEAWGYATKGIVLFQHYTKEKNAKARELLKKAVKLDPNYATGWIFLAWTHFIDFRFGFSESRGESLKRCIEITQKAETLDHPLPELHSIWNTIYLAQGQYDKAIAQGKKAIELGPSDATSHILLSMTLHNAGRFEESIFYAKEAMRLNPYYPNWYLAYVALSYCMTGEYDKAIVPLNKVIERAKNEGSQILPYQLRLVEIYVGLDQIKEAKALATEVLKLNPNFSLQEFKKRLFYKNPADVDRYFNMLRKAGLPDKPPLPLPDKPSIAVLAFDNLSGDPEQEYFSDGIAENIITALSKSDQLFVIARNSSFTYKGKPVKIQKVGRELGVRYVLEGSVRRSGDKVRITAQLIDARNGQHLWAEDYDRDFENILDITAVQNNL